jgi:dTDP-4-dehydrorhamnose 3,5-epimerase-like enzyme
MKGYYIQRHGNWSGNLIEAINMTFEFKKLKIQDVIVIKPKVFEDERGFFMETFIKLTMFTLQTMKED